MKTKIDLGASGGNDAVVPDTATGQPAEFITEAELLRRIPICRRTLLNWRQAGKLSFVNLGGRRVLFHWPSVTAALLRHQHGGAND